VWYPLRKFNEKTYYTGILRDNLKKDCSCLQEIQTLSFPPSPATFSGKLKFWFKLGAVPLACNPSTWVDEAG
jgi:hypothetical protein